MYELVFSEIEEHKNKLGITEANLTTDPSFTTRIEKRKTITN